MYSTIFDFQMEPMNIGSAPSSPASPGANSNFLPSFLIGDLPPSTPNNTLYPNVSPGRNKTPSSFKNNTVNESMSLRQKLFNQSLAETPVGTPSPYQPVEKSGPPTTGLFDTFDVAKRVTSPVLSSTVVHLSEPVLFNESISRIHPTIPSEETFTPSRSYNNSTRMEQHLNTHWVTAFGFPPSLLNVVLSQLSNCGVIVDKQVPAQGNWVHIKFSNFGEVNRALALNGKCLNSNIMIGVQLYYPKENKENSGVMASPMRARSLRHSFISPHASNTVVPAQNVPQKSTGIVSKAMEYVFGW